MHSPQCYESSFSYIIMHHSATSEEVAETWEEDDTGKRLDQVIRRRKKLKEMSEKMEATAHLPQKDGNGLPGKQSDEKRQIQILKRPTGAARVTNEKPTTSQLKQLAHPTVEERMVSYMEARNRIFGKSPTSLQERNSHSLGMKPNDEDVRNKVTVPEGIGTRYAPNVKRKSSRSGSTSRVTQLMMLT
ncbi:hypothetical protein T03_15619 [Trichinella britovi]|uniref:SUZ domain-containing protein n=1 Tax=Trichinella britovi TaxID=45882 RepID=A0A0V1DA44_TRIBR|nr:hypothetical protein T03_15619 [Trichinella britovi]